MTSTGSKSAEARLESLLKPYRDLSNEHMELIWTEFAAEHPSGSFPSTKTMRQNSRLFRAGKRYRFALALAGYRLLMGERPSQDLERAATWLEWYHLYTLFLDDIMDEDFRRRKFPSAWSSNARLYRGADGARPATVFRTRRHRYGVSQAILDALRIRSLAEWAIERAAGLHPSVRLELLAELTTVDLILSDGQGLDIDFERAADIPEEAYVRMSEAKTAASTWERPRRRRSPPGPPRRTEPRSRRTRGPSQSRSKIVTISSDRESSLRGLADRRKGTSGKARGPACMSSPADGSAAGIGPPSSGPTAGGRRRRSAMSRSCGTSFGPMSCPPWRIASGSTRRPRGTRCVGSRPAIRTRSNSWKPSSRPKVRGRRDRSRRSQRAIRPSRLWPRPLRSRSGRRTSGRV